MEYITLKELYQRMQEVAGPSGWWPADSKEEILLGAILVQNTNWQNAARSLENLKTATGFHPEKLAALSRTQIKELIRPSGFYENKSRTIYELVQKLSEAGFDYQGIQQEKGETLRVHLLAFHGIGPETADVLRLYVFDQVAFVADSYARRLFSQLGLGPLGTYAALAKQVNLTDFSLEEAQDFHGQIDEFGKCYLQGKNRFEESFLKDYRLLL